MPDFETNNGHTQILIPLRIKPFSHKESPTITGNAFGEETGTVMYGHYNMEYLLPGGDRLRLIANHDKKTVQLMLFTHNPEILKSLPGDRPSSLVADVISKIHRYRIRSASYKQPLSHPQQQKLQLANECINSLSILLKNERRLKCYDHVGHEQLRRKVLSILKQCRNKNRMLADNPIISEGFLGTILYDAHKSAQYYQFNGAHNVSRRDQMDFTKIKNKKNVSQLPCFVWDSELHIGHDSNSLDDALRVICRQYNLIPAATLNDLPANRLDQLETFFRQLWNDGQDWMKYLSINNKPTHKTNTTYTKDGVCITRITPYYKLKGLPQRGYVSLDKLIQNLTDSLISPIQGKSIKEAKKILEQLPNGNWVILPKTKQLILRIEDKFVNIHYFIQDNLFYPLPEGQDLYTLSQISKRHLYLPERISLKISAFTSGIPNYLKDFFNNLSQFLVHDLHDEFVNHIHETHVPQQPYNNPPPSLSTLKYSLNKALKKHGFLENGQSLEEFIREQINSSSYIIARANHPQGPPLYTNPFHRILGIARHAARLFIDTSEHNPIVGTFAMAAYIYGAGAILAPEALTKILIKLHLKGLIAGIEPTQILGHWLSHGTTSEAISVSTTYWQATVVGGNLDKFFIDAITALKDDPAEIAIISALALCLGYGITKIVPSLQNEIGDFPYITYAALGGKGGAAAYDTIMRPGDDWLLGTCKWFCKNMIILSKIFIAPFFEGYHYGYKNGFIRGWGKSFNLTQKLLKQFIVTIIDLALVLLTIPLLELGALLIHIPFRGITNFIRKLLAILGNISVIGELLISIAQRPSLNNFLSDLRLSSLYGFTSPFGHFSNNFFVNAGKNILRLIFLLPLQFFKNFLILPLIDLSSLFFRISISVINPISRVIIYSLGITLVSIGSIWDNTIGIIFSFSGNKLTQLCNFLDDKAEDLKQNILSLIEIIRKELYYWAFNEKDSYHSDILDDQEYFYHNPKRFELIPHSEDKCLIHKFLNKEKNSPENINNISSKHYYGTFFKKESIHFNENTKATTLNIINNDTKELHPMPQNNF